MGWETSHCLPKNFHCASSRFNTQVTACVSFKIQVVKHLYGSQLLVFCLFRVLGDFLVLFWSSEDNTDAFVGTIYIYICRYATWHRSWVDLSSFYTKTLISNWCLKNPVIQQSFLVSRRPTVGETDDHHPPQPPTAAGAPLNITANTWNNFLSSVLKKSLGNHWSKTKSWRHLDLVPGNRHSISELFFLSAEYRITKLQTINGTVFPPFLESSPTLWGRLHVFMSQKPRAERRSEDLPTVEASLSSSTSPTSYTNAHNQTT